MAETVQGLALTPIYPAITPIPGIEPSLYLDGLPDLLTENDELARAIAEASPASVIGSGPLQHALPALKISAPTAMEVENFAERLRRALHDAGIDTATPIELSVRADGSIAATHQDAKRIEAAINGDADLANEYRSLVARCDIQAQGQLTAAYIQNWNDAPDDKAREAVWRRYSGLTEKLSCQASGRLLLDPSGATALSMLFIRERGID